MSPTVPLKPEILFRLTETDADFPAGTVSEVVLSDSLNCGPETVTGTDTDCWFVPLFAEMKML